jgi:hypothetical protein
MNCFRAFLPRRHPRRQRLISFSQAESGYCRSQAVVRAAYAGGGRMRDLRTECGDEASKKL